VTLLHPKQESCLVRRLVPVLLAGLLAAAGAVAPSPLASAAAAAASGPKIVLIVGATHAATDSYRADMDTVYATALQYSSNVVKVYSPDATWSAVKAAIQGASIVVYMGHGNGFPSPYLSTLWPDRMDGFGLNAVAGQGDSNTTYYGESYIASSVRLAPNAVVILAHLCYASGNSEPGLTPPTLAIAEARIDNFAAGFLQAGARAVIADAHSDTSWYLDQLFTTHQTLDLLFRTKPSGAGNTFTFPSSRTPGLTDYSDPDTAAPPSDFYRSMVTQPTLRTDDVTGAASPAVVGQPVTLTVPGAAEVTAAGGIGLYPDPSMAPNPATGAAPALLPDGTQLHVLASANAPAGGLAYRVATLDGTRTGFVAPVGLAQRDGSPPVISGLTVVPAAFNPTLGQAATISATASKPVAWSVAITDGAGSTITTLTGSGPTFTATWNARDAAGQALPDGAYRLVATAIDAWGNPPVTAAATLGLSGTPPVLSLTGTRSLPMLVSPNGDGLNDTARLTFVVSKPATIVTSVRDAAGGTLRTLTLQANAGPGVVTWDGLGAAGTPVPDGQYVLEVTARDAAGNVGAGVTVPVVIATARSRVAAVPAWISPSGRGADPRVSTLTFALTRPARVTWQVTTAAGVPVRTWFVDAPLAAGVHTVSWNGRGDAGALAPRGRYLSQVTVSDGATSTTEQAWVYSDGIRILASDTTPAASQLVTFTVVAVEALGANPTVWITQPGRARIGYRTAKVGTSTYRVQLRLRTGPAGTLTVKVTGVDRFGRPAGASLAYPLH
jgi:flagellar hook assembly protein FlgD